MVQKILLSCGILASLLHIGMNIFIPMQWDEYNIASQTVSELSAIGAPTRTTWVMWGIVYTVLVLAFGWGVWKAGKDSRFLRIAGILMIIHGVFGLFWPPMHQREVLAAGGGTLTDTLHIVWTMITIPMFMAEIGFGAAALGRGFRIYSIVSIIILIAFGVLTGIDSPAMEADLPTPYIGVWERISMAGYMIWVIVFALILLRKEKGPAAGIAIKNRNSF